MIADAADGRSSSGTAAVGANSPASSPTGAGAGASTAARGGAGETIVTVEAGTDPVMLTVSKKLLDFALHALIDAITENRGSLGPRELSLQLRSTGVASELTALFSIKGKQLELEGVLPEPFEGAVPNQGRIPVFLAKEIIRLHHGEIHAGPGMEGTEILISFRNR